jgi:hypothetical protein
MKVRTSVHSGASWYSVQDADSLAKIAQAFYGPSATADDVIRIYQTNKTAIGIDPCALQTGQALWIPDRPSPAPIPTPIPPKPKPPKPPKPKPPMPGACTERWGNGVCLYKECPYPPFQLPCD